jgi:hypothetical protein
MVSFTFYGTIVFVSMPKQIDRFNNARLYIQYDSPPFYPWSRVKNGLNGNWDDATKEKGKKKENSP